MSELESLLVARTAINLQEFGYDDLAREFLERHGVEEHVIDRMVER